LSVSTEKSVVDGAYLEEGFCRFLLTANQADMGMAL
jgi:hypothetical protein